LSSKRNDEEALPPWPKHTFDLPTRLADGLGLESALIRSAIIVASNLRPVEIFARLSAMRSFPFGSPATAPGDAALGCIGIHYIDHLRAAAVFVRCQIRN
jgi:hypothetical protein